MYEDSFLHVLAKTYCFLIILIGVRWNLTVVLIHLIDANEMISDAEYIFICLLVVCMSSLENCLFISSVHFKNQFFFLLSLNCLCSLYIMSWLAWEVTQSCLILCDPIDCNLPGSSIHGIFQARVMEWVAISFCRGSSQLRDQTWVSCIAGRHFTIWATRKACGFYGY